jgi:hypothetical protein
MNAPAAQIVTIPEVIGTPYGGGFYAGRYMEGDQLCILIAAPKAEGEHKDAAWNRSLAAVTGAGSYFDGAANTRAMAEAGSSLAKWALELNIGGETNWFLPARDQLELLYRHFKPTAEENYVYRNGDNPSSVPPGYPYTEAVPGQTALEAFRAGGAEAFEDTWYWSSTQHASDSDCAWYQYFDDGGQGFYPKNGKLRARAVRRLKI